MGLFMNGDEDFKFIFLRKESNFDRPSESISVTAHIGHTSTEITVKSLTSATKHEMIITMVDCLNR